MAGIWALFPVSLSIPPPKTPHFGPAARTPLPDPPSRAPPAPAPPPPRDPPGTPPGTPPGPPPGPLFSEFSDFRAFCIGISYLKIGFFAISALPPCDFNSETPFPNTLYKKFSHPTRPFHTFIEKSLPFPPPKPLSPPHPPSPTPSPPIYIYSLAY